MWFYTICYRGAVCKRNFKIPKSYQFIHCEQMQTRNILLILCCQQIYAQFTFSTLNYPNPVVGPVAKQHFDVPAEGSLGVAVLFKEFLVGPGDCVILCETSNSDNCTSLCGDVMDHPKTKKIMRSTGASRLTIVNEAASDGLAHNGIAGKVVNIDPSNPTYFKCNTTYSLTETDTFYFVSQNYPYTPTDFTSCQVKFKASNSIRFAFYDFVSDQFIDNFVISGLDLNNTQQNLTFGGRHVTDDEPFGVYFNKEATISFQFVNTTGFYYQRGFYIIVDDFTSSAVNQNCGNTGHTLVDINKKYQIGAPLTGFSSAPYANNMQCFMNFTTTAANTVLYLDLQYESEKCCDTMDLSGLTPLPFDTATYQGQQGRLIYLAANPTVTMNFQSDGVQGGVGFRGVVTSLDCSCGGDYTLSKTTPLAKVMTPNFSNGAPTYCPQMNCQWTVSIPPEIDTQLVFRTITLRKQFSAVYDTLVMTDNFGNVIKSFQSGPLTITPNMYPTSGKITFLFNSCNSTSFTVNMMAVGFQIDMLARNRQLIRKNISFTDDYMFEDISAYNFNIGKQQTLEFLVTARAGKQVSFYFFTQILHWAYVDVYDGPDTSSELMDISNIIYNAGLGNGSHVDPPKVKSTKGVLLIRLKAYTEDATNQNMDFQGFVTDYENTGDCGNLVLSNSAAESWLSTGTFKTNCIKVLRSTDLKYNSLLATYLSLGSSDGVKLYKGLVINEQHKIYSYIAPPDLFVADKYVIADISANNNLNYTWKVLGESTAMTLPTGQVGTIMTADFLPDHSTLQEGSFFQQQFTLELLATGSDITGIKLELLAPAGTASNVTIEMEKYNDLLSSQTYVNGKLPSSIENCGKKVVIAYESIVGQNQGLYAKYSKGTLDCSKTQSASLSKYIYTFIYVFLLLL